MFDRCDKIVSLIFTIFDEITLLGLHVKEKINRKDSIYKKKGKLKISLKTIEVLLLCFCYAGFWKNNIEKLFLFLPSNKYNLRSKERKDNLLLRFSYFKCPKHLNQCHTKVLKIQFHWKFFRITDLVKGMFLRESYKCLFSYLNHLKCGEMLF